MPKRKYKLDPEELEIENGVDYVPVSSEKKKKIMSIIRAAKKNRTISLRISGHVLEGLKERAAEEGVPYQTLINSVLHKYVTNRLHDEREVMHIVRAMKAEYGK